MAVGLRGKTISIRGETPLVPAKSELGKESKTLVSAKSDVTVVGNRTELGNSWEGGKGWR